MDGASAKFPPDDGFHEHKAQHLSREGPPGHGIPVTKTNYLACQYFKQRCRINEHVIRDGSSFRCEECEAGIYRDGDCRRKWTDILRSSNLSSKPTCSRIMSV